MAHKPTARRIKTLGERKSKRWGNKETIMDRFTGQISVLIVFTKGKPMLVIRIEL